MIPFGRMLPVQARVQKRHRYGLTTFEAGWAYSMREPLHFDAPVLLGVLRDRLLPPAADDVDARDVDVVAFVEQLADLGRAVLAQLHRAQRLRPHVRLAALLAELLDQRVVDVAAQQHRRAGADLQQLLDGLEVLAGSPGSSCRASRSWARRGSGCPC